MLLIDAHVHIYDCFDLGRFLNSAYANFKSAAEQRDYGDDFTGILLLAETFKENWFNHLADYADGKDSPSGKDIGNWIFIRTHENNSLIAESGDSNKLILIAGRQIVTDERLEILALFAAESFKDGNPIKNMIEEIKDKGGIPVIPWGFGKWMGRRGNILNRMLETAEDLDFYLGDNGNRPFFIPMPFQFRLAQDRDIPNLPGSDPLPFASEVGRAGCFGIIVPDELPDEKPAAHLKGVLKRAEKPFEEYGALERPYRFFRNQVVSQLRKMTKG